MVITLCRWKNLVPKSEDLGKVYCDIKLTLVQLWLRVSSTIIAGSNQLLPMANQMMPFLKNYYYHVTLHLLSNVIELKSAITNAFSALWFDLEFQYSKLQLQCLLSHTGAMAFID